MNRSNFKLIYFDKNNRALDLLLLYLNFYQELFDENEKFGTLDIIAFGKLDRMPHEIYADNTKDPILILSMNQKLPLYKINGEFLLPLYVRHSEILGVYDNERALYRFHCKPFVFSIFNSHVTPFSIKINPKKDKKLPNIKEVIREFVSRQSQLLPTGKALVVDAYTKVYDLMKTDNKTDLPTIKSSDASFEEELEDFEEDSEESFEKSYQTGVSFVTSFVPEHAKPFANRFFKEAHSLISVLEKRENILSVEEITLKNLPPDKITEIEKVKIPPSNISIQNQINISIERKNKISSDISNIKSRANSIKNSLSQKINQFLNFINAVCSAIAAGIQSIANFVNRIGAIISGFLQTLTNYINNIINFVSQIISSIINTISQFLNGFINQLYSLIRKISQEISQLLNNIGSGDCKNLLINSTGMLVNSFGSLFSTIANIPLSLSQNLSSAISKFQSSFNQFTSPNFPSLQDVISLFERGASNAYENLCSKLSNVILVNPCKKPKIDDFVSVLKPIEDLLNLTFPFIKPGNVIKPVLNNIIVQTDLFQRISDYPRIEQVVRDFVRDELSNLSQQLSSDQNTMSNLVNNLFNEIDNFLNSLNSAIPPNSPDPMEQALDRRVDEALSTLPNINVSPFISFLDPNSPFWQETFEFLEDYISGIISLFILDFQHALALLSYEGQTTTNPAVSGIIDPIKEIQIVFGLDQNEINAFDEVSQKIVKRLEKTFVYPIYEGTIFTALNKTIGDLCPTPFANFVSVVYYTKDGKSHAFFRYRLYPGEMELGRSDLEIGSGNSRPTLINPDNFLVIQSAFMKKTGEDFKNSMHISNSFSGFPTGKMKFSSVLNGLEYSVEIDVKEEFSKLVFCGSSLFSDKKNFLTVNLPSTESQNADLPVSINDTSYNGLMAAKLLGRISNSLVENSLIKQEATFLGVDAYALFLLLWPGDVLMLNISSLIEKSPLILKTPHIFLPRYLITRKRFQYLNTDYKAVVEKYVTIDFDQSFKIDFLMASNDDGLKSSEDFSGQSYANAIEKAKKVWTMFV